MVKETAVLRRGRLVAGKWNDGVYAGKGEIGVRRGARERGEVIGGFVGVADVQVLAGDFGDRGRNVEDVVVDRGDGPHVDTIDGGACGSVETCAFDFVV